MKRTNFIKASASVLLGAAMLQGCGVADLLDDLSDALDELGTEDVELYTDAVGAELNDAVDMMGVMGSLEGVGDFEPKKLSLSDNGDEAKSSSSAPAFDTAGFASTEDNCAIYLVDGVDDPVPLPAFDNGNICQFTTVDGDITQNYVFYAWMNWAAPITYDGTVHPVAFPTDVTYLGLFTKQQTHPTAGQLLFPAISVLDFYETEVFGNGTREVSVANLTHPDYTTLDTEGDADIFDNWAKATKTITYSDTAETRAKSIIETFVAHMQGTPAFAPQYWGMNGEVDGEDLIAKYTRLVEARNGRLHYTSAVAGDEYFSYEDDDLKAGTYSEVITLEAGAISTIERTLVVGDSGARMNEVVSFASGVTGYKNTTITGKLISVYGVRPDGTVEEISVDASDESAMVITRTVTFPEGRKVAKLEETWTPTENGGTVVRTVTLDDASTLEVTITITDDGEDTQTITVDRGDLGTATLTLSPGEEEGTIKLVLETTGAGDVSIKATAVLDDLGTGEVDIEIDNPATEQAPDLEGTLNRAADGSLTGTLTKYLKSGDSIDVPVNRDSANPDRRLEAIRGNGDNGAGDDGAGEDTAE